MAAFTRKRGVIAFGVAERFEGRHLHMHGCPSARSGVAKGKGGGPGGGSPGLHEPHTFLGGEEGRGNPVGQRSFTLARREGSDP